MKNIGNSAKSKRPTWKSNQPNSPSLFSACEPAHEADQRAKETPIYSPDAIPTLNTLKETGITLRLSIGRNAEEKAHPLANHTDTNPTTQSKHSLASTKTTQKGDMKTLQTPK